MAWAGQSRCPRPRPPPPAPRLLERQSRGRGRSTGGQMADHLEAPARKETLLAQGAPAVRAGRRRSSSPRCHQGRALKLHQSPPPRPPAEGGPNQHNAPAPRRPPGPERDCRLFSPAQGPHCVWMSGPRPPRRSAEVSSEHIRTFQVAQKLPRRQSATPTPQRPRPRPAPEHTCSRGSRRGRGRPGLQGARGEREPPQRAGRRAEHPRRRQPDPSPGPGAPHPSSAPGRLDSLKAKEDRCRAASRRHRPRLAPAPRPGSPRRAPAPAALWPLALSGLAAWPAGPGPRRHAASLLVGACRGGVWGHHTMPRECCSLHLRRFLEVLKLP